MFFCIKKSLFATSCYVLLLFQGSVRTAGSSGSTSRTSRRSTCDGIPETHWLTANASHGRSEEVGEHDFTVEMHSWLRPAFPSKNKPNECCPSFWTAWRVHGRPQVNRIKKGVCVLFLGLPRISHCRSTAVDQSCSSCYCSSTGGYKKCKRSRQATFWQQLKQIHVLFQKF